MIFIVRLGGLLTLLLVGDLLMGAGVLVHFVLAGELYDAGKAVVMAGVFFMLLWMWVSVRRRR